MPENDRELTESEELESEATAETVLVGGTDLPEVPVRPAVESDTRSAGRVSDVAALDPELELADAGDSDAGDSDAGDSDAGDSDVEPADEDANEIGAGEEASKCGRIKTEIKYYSHVVRGKRRKVSQSLIQRSFRRAFDEALGDQSDSFFTGAKCKGSCPKRRIIVDLKETQLVPRFRRRRGRRNVRIQNRTEVRLFFVVSYYCLGRGEVVDVGDETEMTREVMPDGGVVRIPAECTQTCPPIEDEVVVTDDNLDLEEADIIDDLAVDLREKAREVLDRDLGLRLKQCICEAPCGHTLVEFSLGDPMVELKVRADGTGFFEGRQTFSARVLCVKPKTEIAPPIRQILRRLFKKAKATTGKKRLKRLIKKAEKKLNQPR